MIKTLIYFLLGILGLTSFLTPFAVELLKALNLASNYPFSRIYDRVALIAALIMIFILRKSFDLSVFKKYFKDFKYKSSWKYLILGFLISLSFVLAILPFLANSNRWSYDTSNFSKEIYKLLMFIPAAFLLAFIEEALFRVIIQNKLKEKFTNFSAVLVVSFVYALVHFIQPNKSFIYQDWNLLAGFEYIFVVFKGYQDLNLLAGFMGLFLVGVVLSLVFLKTSLFFLVVGLHAGLAFCLKMSKYFLSSEIHSSGRYILLLEPLACLSIILIGVFCLLFFKSKDANNNFC